MLSPAGSGCCLITGWPSGGRSLDVAERRVISGLGHHNSLCPAGSRSCVWKPAEFGHVELEGHLRETSHLSKGKASSSFDQTPLGHARERVRPCHQGQELGTIPREYGEPLKVFEQGSDMMESCSHV